MKKIKVVANALRLLLVEGRDAEVFFLKLLEYMGISDDIPVVSYGGPRQFLALSSCDPERCELRAQSAVNQHCSRRADYNTIAFYSVLSALGHANESRGADREFSIPRRALARSEAAHYVSVLIVPSDDEGA